MKTGEHWNSRNSSNSYKRSRFWVAESEQLQWQTSWWFRLRETCDILTSLPAKPWTIKFSMDWRLLPTPGSCRHLSPHLHHQHLDHKVSSGQINTNPACLVHESAQPTLTGDWRGEIIWSWALPRHFGQHHHITFMRWGCVFVTETTPDSRLTVGCVKYFTK